MAEESLISDKRGAVARHEAGMTGAGFHQRNQPVVLVFVSHFFPGYRAGGPVRSLVNLIERLRDEFRWKVITTDRDFNAREAYSGVHPDSWSQVGNAEVYYTSPSSLSLGRILRLIRSTPYDLLYLNSFFSPRFSVLPIVARKFHMLPRPPVLIAPRGEFSDGAYRLKRWKKAPFVAVTRMLRVHADVNWHASTDLEAADICRVMAIPRASVHIASNLSETTALHDSATARRRGAELRVCFLSRISRTKNLDFALRVLAEVQQPILFTVYGPKEDSQYWAECEALAQKLPPNIRFHYAGSVAHENVHTELIKHDLFFLPTRGENYGHVIHEALSAGLVLLTSDQTPWDKLEERGVGWNLPLSNPDAFAMRIERVAGFTDEERLQWATRAQIFAADVRGHMHALEDNRRMFLDVLAGGTRVIGGKAFSSGEDNVR